MQQTFDFGIIINRWNYILPFESFNMLGPVLSFEGVLSKGPGFPEFELPVTGHIDVLPEKIELDFANPLSPDFQSTLCFTQERRDPLWGVLDISFVTLSGTISELFQMFTVSSGHLFLDISVKKDDVDLFSQEWWGEDIPISHFQFNLAGTMVSI